MFFNNQPAITMEVRLLEASHAVMSDSYVYKISAFMFYTYKNIFVITFLAGKNLALL